jgi:hypothetical protein
VLRKMSNQLIEVDGRPVEAGAEAPVRPGTTVRLAQVMTLRFLGSEQAHSARDAVTLQHGAEPKDLGSLHETARSFEDTSETGEVELALVPAG